MIWHKVKGEDAVSLSRHWVANTIKRLNLAKRIAQDLPKKSAKLTEHDILEWFETIEDGLKEEELFHLLQNAEFQLNGDETSYRFCPKTSRYVITPKGAKNVSRVADGSKENMSILVTVRATGQVLRPLVIYKGERMPGHIQDHVNQDELYVAHSQNGWMTGSIFAEYLNTLNAELTSLGYNMDEQKFVFFVDGFGGHKTFDVCEMAMKKGFVLIQLPPNSTHIMQPLDVTVFSTFKKKFDNLIESKLQPHGCPLRLSKQMFAGCLVKVLKEIPPDLVIRGFEKCGLFPWGFQNVDLSRLLDQSTGRTFTPPSKTRLIDPHQHIFLAK